MDILSKLGIGISGLVSRHGFQTGPRLPDPIDDLIKPNADPFDREEDRASFVKLLIKNSQIDMKNTQCVILILDTVNLVVYVAWRARYPLPEAQSTDRHFSLNSVSSASSLNTYYSQ